LVEAKLHEWSIADGIVSSVLEKASELNAERVREVEIVVGELRDLEIDILREAVAQLSKGTPAEEAKYVFKKSEARFRCLSCGETWGMKKALDILSSQLEDEEYVLESGELEPPIHFMPMLIIGLQRCPKCGGMDIEVESGQEVTITKIVLESEEND